jgi:hypothetical protein
MIYHCKLHYYDQWQSDMLNTYSSKLSYTANRLKFYIHIKKITSICSSFWGVSSEDTEVAACTCICRCYFLENPVQILRLTGVCKLPIPPNPLSYSLQFNKSFKHDMVGKKLILTASLRAERKTLFGIRWEYFRRATLHSRKRKK